MSKFLFIVAVSFLSVCVSVAAEEHPNLDAAEGRAADAYWGISNAQIANGYDMAGHAAKAKQLLKQALAEIQAVNPADGAQRVGVEGRHFTLNGKPWMPRGVMIRGFVGAPAFLKDQVPNTFHARLNFGQEELDAARRFGADTLRFQLSQPSFDPLDPLFDAEYKKDIVTAIQLARRNGFVVDISMQDEWRSGEATLHPFAIAQTVRNWDELNTLFGTDEGVMFELYNEPHAPNTPENWRIWKFGDGQAGPTAAVGMQTMVNRLRSQGSRNVIVVDGLNYANTLHGVLDIEDPLQKIAYAVHPYLHGNADPSRWGERFGDASRVRLVYANEWSSGADSPLGLKGLKTYQPAVDLLNYLREHEIPLSAGEFDVEGVLIDEVPGWTPSSYSGSTPQRLKGNVGMLVHTLYQTRYARPLTPADALTP